MNFNRFCAIGCIFLFLLLAPGSAFAATVHGTVYEWYSFEPLNNSVIEVNSTPEQYFIATDAAYSFNLSPGSYLITASYFEEGTLVYLAEETVLVSEEGDYVLDLLVFPPESEELLDQGGFEELNRDLGAAGLLEEEANLNTGAVFFLIALSTLLLGAYFWKKRSGKTYETSCKPLIESEAAGKIPLDENLATEAGSSLQVETEPGGFAGASRPESSVPPAGSRNELNEPAPLPAAISDVRPDFKLQDDPEANIPEDLKEILELIRANGNRITQRELRKKSRYSESKVSLMLSDLEERGLIEKYKKGRGNILRIPDEAVRKQVKYLREMEEKNKRGSKD